MIIKHELEPIPHFKMTDYIRVPVHKSGDDYIVHIGKKNKRIYTLSTLPSFITSKLTVANVLSNNTISDEQLDPSKLFICHEDVGDPDLAWKASDSYYIIIIHHNEFLSLLGLGENDT